MTVNNSLSNEKMVGGLPRIGRFLLRNLACSALVPGPAAGHQCATSLAPLSDSFPAKWLSTQKNIANGRGCAFCHSQRVHMYPIPSDQDRTLLEVCHGCCPFLARLRFPLAVLSVRIRTRTSALGILACATAQVMCHPPVRHWTSGDLFDIRGAVYVEHDGHAKTLDGSSSLHTHCPFFNNFHTEVDGRIRFIFR